MAFITPMLTIGTLMPVRPSVRWMIGFPFSGAMGCCTALHGRGKPTTPADAMANDACDKNFLLLLSGLFDDILVGSSSKNLRMMQRSTLEEMDELRIAPDGGALAFVTRRGEGFGDGQVRSLSVIAARAGGKPVLVADRVSEFPDWSPDSRDLVYIRCEAKDSGETRLGRITRRTVRDTHGAILENPSEAVDLATVIFRDTLKVRCLLDGRILFAAAGVALPAGNNQISNRLTMFSLDPGQVGSVSRILPRSMDQNLPDRADLFEVSADGRYAAIPGSKGRISRVTLATGEVTAIIGKDSSGDLRTIPVWRNSQQLCLVAPAGSGYTSSKRDEVILWSEGQATSVSQSWPDKVLEGIK